MEGNEQLTSQEFLIQIGVPVLNLEDLEDLEAKYCIKVKYRSISSAASEVRWMVRLLEELGVNNLKTVSLHCNIKVPIIFPKIRFFTVREPSKLKYMYIIQWIKF